MKGNKPLWLGLYCPALPLHAAWPSYPGDALLAVHDTRGRARIVQASRAALAAGVRPGQTLTDALALAPALHSRPRNPALENRMLEVLAMLAYGFSHQVALVDDQTVILEIAGSQRLYGGTERLLENLSGKAREQGLPIQAGSAPNPTAARLLARTGQHCSDSHGLEQILRPLPLERLALPVDQARALAGCGLRRIGELARLPAAERARRFGPGLNNSLAELFGQRPTPVAAWTSPEHYQLRLELPAATADSNALLFVFRRATTHLGQWLQVRDQALVQLHIQLLCQEHAEAVSLSVGLSQPGQACDRLLELIGLKLDALTLPAPVNVIVLSAETTAGHQPPQADLFSGRHRGDAWSALLDRLQARLGTDGLAGLTPVADHRPEKAWSWTRPGHASESPTATPRPQWLLPRPRPCQRESLRLEQGPERIESGWWDGGDCRRDYWIARDRHGRRLWVFYEQAPKRGWFLHGVFDS
ncbi:DNA polymerase Y family protein [Wenzhouxiangella sp. AB-CW3]|uniref:Y-family DNA polymerase n=1 Tax=Wenzhouxiangella sp. AB-CW3 TaxID=2771012 RepID=UPI00168A7A3D|nr:DNA polymerase Y family protein [Wenzhouxiangella sp. AB-CW3]QOC23842.1 DNA polymerase Y family protein [Wenzhouxiangella sp. AB-CW3]